MNWNRSVVFGAWALLLCGFTGNLLAADSPGSTRPSSAAASLEERFDHPPAEARPQVYWFWMGSNVSEAGITRDLEALKDAGFGGTTMCHLSDVCTPWAGVIGNSPPSDIVAYQSESWWRLIRFAAAESRRLGIEFGIHNCAGYESSGGPWITPELSMQEVVWSETRVSGPANFDAQLPRPQPDLHAHQPFPVYNPKTGALEKPLVAARQTYFEDIAVLAMPADGAVAKDSVVNLSAQLDGQGHLKWDVPAGEWIIYRFGHTTMGAMLQPCQWDAMGLECDKMSRVAVEFHLRHVLGEAKSHLGDLFGTGLNYIWFDSYEAGTPSWTPKMREEFIARRGYDLTPFLATMAKRTIGSSDETKRFQADFQQTIRDLYRDVYFATIQRECHAAGIEARAEPYTGPWKIAEAIPYFDQVCAEFWTRSGRSTLPEVVAGARAANMNIISAEAFTGGPRESQWSETPEWLKPIGDAAFCAGINRLMLHRFVHQPFDDRYQPGMAMGQWGTHFDRTQTWWEPGKAWVKYLQRCQALLQWGKPAPSGFSAEPAAAGLTLRSVHRSDGAADVFFVANLARAPGAARCTFDVAGRKPELWDPVSGARRDLSNFEASDGKTIVPLDFAAAQSMFVVFQTPAGSPTTAGTSNFPQANSALELTGPWQVRFDPRWGGPAAATFDTLVDWTQRSEPGIKYFSGTAVYSKSFDLPAAVVPGRKAPIWLDLGTVHAMAQVRVNGADLGVLWTAPWRVDISPAVRTGSNTIEIGVTNVWANRLIGDEQQPADCEWNKGDQGFGGPLKAFPDWFIKSQPRPSAQRFTFTTWNYFTKDSPLIPSGLIGPVRLMIEP